LSLLYWEYLLTQLALEFDEDFREDANDITVIKLWKPALLN
jgi:hypothetical protein